MYWSQLVFNVVLLGYNMWIFLEHRFLSSVTSKRNEIPIMRRNEDLEQQLLERIYRALQLVSRFD